MVKDKYILIDSGIDLNNKELSQNIIGGVNFYFDNNGNVEIEEKLQDVNGHGTMCASTILNVYKKASPFIVNIINENGKTRYDLLVEGLKYCLNVDIDIICLSMATINTKAYESIKGICDKLRDRGKLIISSVHNNFFESLPANLESVIGVIGNDFNGCKNSFYFNSSYEVQACFDGLPHFAYSTDNQLVLFKGNSKANALMVGNILKISDENNFFDYDELIKYLNKKSLKKNWIRKDITIKKPFNNSFDIKNLGKLDKEIGTNLINIINSNFNKDVKLNESFSFPILSYKTGLNFNNCYNFLKEVEAIFDIKLNFMDLNAVDFCTMDRLINLVKGYIK
jgi:hypothetical protein